MFILLTFCVHACVRTASSLPSMRALFFSFVPKWPTKIRVTAESSRTSLGCYRHHFLPVLGPLKVSWSPADSIISQGKFEPPVHYLTNVTKLPSGWEMAAYCRGVWIVNLYMRRLSHPTGERKLLQCGTHIVSAFTSPNNDHGGGL